MYFQVHQPYRLRKYNIFDIAQNKNYYDNDKNYEVLKKIVNKCYLRTNNQILELIRKTDGKLKVSYSLTGVLIEQLLTYFPDVIESFCNLSKTNNVEFLSETYYHSLSYLFSKKEFKEQLKMHSKVIKKIFHQTPKVFRNTELIYNNEIANFVQGLGYKAILIEGADHILNWRSPNFIYTPKTAPDIKLLLKNYRLSDDIAFRFSQQTWSQFPLTAPKYATWINAVNGNGNLVNLFLDYETFGEHQWDTTGIFDFLENLPSEILKNPYNDFVTVSQAVNRYQSVGELDIHNIISWADIERDLSAWLSNPMQHTALSNLYKIEQRVKATKDKDLLEDWRRLQISDHFYYMCTKYFNDGDVHKYFNPYDSPHQAFVSFMNVYADIIIRLKNLEVQKNEAQKNNNTRGTTIPIRS